MPFLEKTVAEPLVLRQQRRDAVVYKLEPYVPLSPQPLVTGPAPPGLLVQARKGARRPLEVRVYLPAKPLQEYGDALEHQRLATD